jgi:hypothetical protein
MDDLEQRLQDISEIRGMMERATKFISLSGLSGVSAGAVALIGAAVAAWTLRSGAPQETVRGILVADAVAVLVAALALSAVFSSRVARRKGYPLWTSTTKRVVVALTVPLIAGGAMSVALLLQGADAMVSSVMLVFYGLALLNASTYTLSEVRLLSGIQVVLGIAAGFLPQYALAFWAAGFGVVHIIYGVAMYLKYER